MRMVRWMSDVKVERETRNRRNNLGTTAKQVATVRACVAKEDNDWAKKGMEYEVDGSRPRGRPKRDMERGGTNRLSST